MEDLPIRTRIPLCIKASAESRARDLGKLRNSLKKGEGNVAGYTGEFLFAEMFGGEILEREIVGDLVFHCDIIHPVLGKVEVKTKQTTASWVDLDYEASISDFNPDQKYDYVAFFRVNLKKDIGWFCGYLSREEYFAKARFIQKGDYDPTNDWTAPCDCYNVYYREMRRDLKLRPQAFRGTGLFTESEQNLKISNSEIHNFLLV